MKNKYMQNEKEGLSDTLGYKLYKVLGEYNWIYFDEHGVIQLENSSSEYIDSIVNQIREVNISVDTIDKDLCKLKISENNDPCSIWEDFIRSK